MWGLGILMATHLVRRLSTMALYKVETRFVMPVRSLNSSVLKWPDKECVLAALDDWVKGQVPLHPEVCAIGYFGSYARGDWGVGSDLDLLIILSRCDIPFERRTLSWPTEQLPVPTDTLIYTNKEWEQLLEQGAGFHSSIHNDVEWIYLKK